jgi:NAD(P)-dependent dehydrogenase (short-subunit alcohol dehydrogenase family)
MTELSGKVAIVTGGSAGIGLGVAAKLVKEGARVVLADINGDAGHEAAEALGSTASFRKVDVSDQRQLRDLVDFASSSLGRLDIMVNNAGIGGARHPRLLDDDFADFQHVMGIDLLGVMAGTREAARVMSANGGGSIINISSIGGITPAPGNWTYHVAKSSVIMFTKCAAIDLGEYNVRVNAIAPGNIETSILGRSMASDMPEERRDAFMASVRKFIMSRQPLQLQGHVNDIAEAAFFFAGERSRYVTGTLLPVDGGMTAGAPPAGAGQLKQMKEEALA